MANAPSPDLESEVEERLEGVQTTSRPKKRRLEDLRNVACAAMPPWACTKPVWKQRRAAVEPPETCDKEVVGVKDFYAFMRRREALRRRRERGLPPEQWTQDQLMARIRLTNVKREDDRTTRVMRKLCNDYVELHPEVQQLRQIPLNRWDFNARMSARWLVFNFALWRAFGTDTFATSIGFLTNRTWNKEEQECVIRKAMQQWKKGQFNYTDAYDPSRSNRRDEVDARICGGAGSVYRLYRRTCASLAGLWQACDAIAEAAVTTSSWRNVTLCVMRVSGYGGTGFLAKELVQDLLHTPLFQTWCSKSSTRVCRCIDINSWCAVGPGARRGLNRLRGRRVNWNAYCADQQIADQFFRELKEVYGQRSQYWNGNLEGFPVFELELHDVQFQLCELDKYEREKKKPGHVRPYTLPKSWENATCGQCSACDGLSLEILQSQDTTHAAEIQDAKRVPDVKDVQVVVVNLQL